MEVLPLNHRAKWTKNEEKQLLKETKMKIDINKIAENHKRTIGAIKFKLIRYVIDLIDIDPSITLEKLLEITNLSKDELFDGFKKVNYHYNEIEDDEIEEDKEDDDEIEEEEDENEDDEEDFKKDIKDIKKDISLILRLIMTSIFAVNIYFILIMKL